MTGDSETRPVIAGYDGLAEGRDAVALGRVLADAIGAPLLVVTSFAVPFEAEGVEALEQGARETNAEGVELAQGATPVEGVVTGAGSPARALHDVAEQRHAAAAVVGSSHRGAIGRVLAGNVASQLLSGSPCPVAVAPRGFAKHPPERLATIGVGFDGGPDAWSALQRAATIALKAGGRLLVIRALDPVDPGTTTGESRDKLEASRRAAELEVERAVASVSSEVSPEPRLVVGEPVRVLETEAREGLDLLVLGSRGFGPLKRVLLGSVSTELVRLVPCPVMVVPRSVEFDPSAGGLAGHDAP